MERLEAELTVSAAHLAAAECRRLLLVAEFDRREGALGWDCVSTAHWLNWRCVLLGSLGAPPVPSSTHTATNGTGVPAETHHVCKACPTWEVVIVAEFAVDRAPSTDLRRSDPADL